MIRRDTGLQGQMDKIIAREIIGRGISDERVIESLRKIPREKFIEGPLYDLNYIGAPLPIGHNQSISGIYTVALMTEALQLNKNHKVLEIGTGSGYQAAVLSCLCYTLFTVERIRELSVKARTKIESMNIGNVVCIIGDGTIGYSEYAPYDRIIVTACSPCFPDILFNQLADGGIMVFPMENNGSQNIFIAEKDQGKTSSRPIAPANFVKLIGKNGF